jgi:hypothetical protein
MVVAEALLVDCCAGESNISSLVQQILGIFEGLLRTFFGIGYDTWSTVSDIGWEYCFGSKEKEEWRVAGGGVGRSAHAP